VIEKSLLPLYLKNQLMDCHQTLNIGSFVLLLLTMCAV
jgi:hypothetical protein